MAEGRFPPWGLRIAAGATAPLAASVRVIERIHGHATHRGAETAPARLPRLADNLVLMLDVTDLPDGGAAAHVDQPHLAARHAHLRIRALLGEQLGRRPGAAHQLGAAAEPDLEVMDGGPERDARYGKRAAGADLGGVAGHHRIADAESDRREEVALVTVCVMRECNARAAIRIVLDVRNLPGHAVLLSFEVDHAVGLLVSATAMANGDAPGVVATGARLQVFGEPPLRFGTSDGLKGGDRHEAPAGAGGLVLLHSHLHALEEAFDLLARPKGDDRLLPAAAFTRHASAPARALPRLAAHVDRV